MTDQQKAGMKTEWMVVSIQSISVRAEARVPDWQMEHNKISCGSDA